MKPHTVLIVAISLIGLWALNGHSERLYTWTDENGEWVISQTPPPPDVQIKDVINYTPPPGQQKPPERPYEEQPDRIAPDGVKFNNDRQQPPPGAGDENWDIRVDRDYDPYRRRDEIKEKIKEKSPNRPRPMPHENDGVTSDRPSSERVYGPDGEKETVNSEKNAPSHRQSHKKHRKK